LTFEAPALNIFPCLGYAFDALRAGASYPVVLNAANEIAVDLFLQNRIGFLDIPALIQRAMDAHTGADAESLEAILALDQNTRAEVRKWAFA
jgi:1-deoxy-D-xylulose-5-phosphate reductoisomerase